MNTQKHGLKDASLPRPQPKLLQPVLNSEWPPYRDHNNEPSCSLLFEQPGRMLLKEETQDSEEQFSRPKPFPFATFQALKLQIIDWERQTSCSQHLACLRPGKDLIPAACVARAFSIAQCCCGTNAPMVATSVSAV